MTDIVKTPGSQDMLKAIEMLHDLRELASEIMTECDYRDMDLGRLRRENEQLRADNARLRGALGEIANVDHQLFDTAADIIEWIISIARRALSEAPKGGEG